MALLVHRSLISGSGQVAGDTQNRHPAALRAIVIHRLVRPSHCGNGCRHGYGVTSGAIQRTGDGGRNVFGYFAHCTQRTLCGVGAVMANITTGGRGRNVVHGFQGKGNNCRPIEFVMTDITLDTRNRDMPRCIICTFCTRSVMATYAVPWQDSRVINVDRRTIERHVVAGINLGMAHITLFGSQHVP